MKVLVTGANGFVGIHMCKYLLKKKCEIYAFIRKTSDIRTLKLIIPDWRKLTFIYGDLNNYSSLISAVKDMDYIFHIAGTIKGSILDEFIQGNYYGTCNLMRAVKNHNSSVKRIIVTSSMVAAGPGTVVNPQCEDVPSKPLKNDLYGISKYMTECIAKCYAKDLPIVVIRPPTVIGPGDKISLDMFKTAKSKLKIFIQGDPRHFSIVHVEDLVNGMWLCCKNDAAINETINFACNGTIPYRDIYEVISTKVFNQKYGNLIPIPISKELFYGIGFLMEMISKITKEPPFLNRSKVAQGIALGQTMNNEKGKMILGWKPYYTIISAIEHAGSWYQENNWI